MFSSIAAPAAVMVRIVYTPVAPESPFLLLMLRITNVMFCEADTVAEIATLTTVPVTDDENVTPEGRTVAIPLREVRFVPDGRVT